jgi:hypothetical protein
MEFTVNHPILFVIAGVVILAVLAQSFFFLVRAILRAKEIGMDMKKIRKTMISCAIFTVAPAVSILVGVLALSKSLGVALPWLRLSIIGSLSYETIAAETTQAQLSEGALTASGFVTVLFVMTFGIILGLILTPILARRIQKGVKGMEKRDKKWGAIFNNAMFLGMISAFLGYVFCDFSNVFHGDTSALIPVLVMASSALIMVACGLLARSPRMKWMMDYALPFSLLGGMAMAIPITAWLM